jgi:TusA-related sulfurtransferase
MFSILELGYNGGNLTKVKPSRKLDCLGLYCPEPVFKTKAELNKMKVGETLEVIADDPAAESDIRSLIKHLHQEIIATNKEGEETHILIKKIRASNNE